MIPTTRNIKVFHGEVHYQAEGYAHIAADLGMGETPNWEAFAAGEQVAASLKTNCYRVTLPNGETVYVKRYVYTAKKKVRYWLLPSKPLIEIYGFQQLRKLGIPTLDVLAYGERRYLGSLRSAYIVTRGVPKSVSVEAFARETWSKMPKDERQSVFLALRQTLLTQLKTAHRAHFFHHDLKWRNILVHETDTGAYELTWIDCPRAHYARLTHRHAVLVDFAGLARSGVEFLSVYSMFRFVRDYVGEEVKTHRAKRLVRAAWENLSKRLPRNYKAAIGHDT